MADAGACECFVIGGPFIGADPNCPFHGDEAKRRDAEGERRRAEYVSDIKGLREHFDALEASGRRMDARFDALERMLDEMKADMRKPSRRKRK